MAPDYPKSRGILNTPIGYELSRIGLSVYSTHTSREAFCTLQGKRKRLASLLVRFQKQNERLPKYLHTSQNGSVGQARDAPALFKRLAMHDVFSQCESENLQSLHHGMVSSR